MGYKNTSNKDAIRGQWDRSILERWHRNYDRPLAYFGLPGPEIEDLLVWRSLLGPRTGIEHPGRTQKERELASETIGRLNMNVLAHGVSSGFQLLRADVADILLSGTDENGEMPLMNDGNRAPGARLSYDVVNLDFDGGLGYRNRQGAAKRLEAIKKLFERQQGHSFVLFLTINVRDTMGNEIGEYLQGLKTRSEGTDWSDIVDWYACRTDGEREYRLKATVPSFIVAAAEIRMFRAICRPPIAYEGHEKAHMVHFAFECESQPGNLRAFGPQDERALIHLPLLRAEGGQLLVPGHQHPRFDVEACRSALSFLPEEIRVGIRIPVAL